MKVYDLIQIHGKDCYVVTVVQSHNEGDVVQDVQIESFVTEFSQVVEKRKTIEAQKMDVLILQPCMVEDVSPIENAEFFHAYYGWNEKKDLPKDKISLIS